MGLFNAPEIADIGIEKEKKRRDFYNQVAEMFKENDQIKELFAKLRDWEETHIEKFTEIRSRTKEVEATEKYPGELNDYIKTLLDDTLYKEVSPAEFSKKIDSPLTAIRYGIEFEKDAILFFNEFLPHTTSSDKDIIQQLANEEKQHLIYLAQLKKDLEK
jgi:rubrerythrin